MIAKRRSARHPSKTHWVLDPKQLAVFTEPRCHDIIDRLAASGPLSIKVLAEMIGARPSALYHHMRRLEAVKLIKPAGTRIRNRRRETLYTTIAPRIRLLRALRDTRNTALIGKINAALCRQMSRDFDAGLQNDPVSDGSDRNLGFFRLVGSPDRKTLAQINKHLEQVAELLWQSSGSSKELVCLGWVLSPLSAEAAKKPRPLRSRSPR